MTGSSNHLASYWSEAPREVWNLGEDELAPFSVVEIVDADNLLILDEPRTRLWVQPAQSNSPNRTVTLGPVRILPEGSGPAFASVESYALYKGNISVGDSVGLAKGETRLSTGQTGYYVIGDIEPDEEGGAGDAVDGGSQGDQGDQGDQEPRGRCRVMRTSSGGNHLFGIAVSSVPHLSAGEIQILGQVGVYNDGDVTAGPSDLDPQQFVVAVNFTGQTIQPGTVNDGPYIIVERPDYFDMPRMVPDQIEPCTTTNFIPNDPP